MAYTWIGSIRHARMDRTVNYAVNPVKTAYNDTELREVSDDLCRKYGLSIIPPDDIGKRRQAYAEWQAERNGQPTWCSAIRQDVDEALARSLSFEQFVRLLRERGYEVKTGVKHMAVRPPGKERFTRLRRLGDDYTEWAIRRFDGQRPDGTPSEWYAQRHGRWKRILSADFAISDQCCRWFKPNL